MYLQVRQLLVVNLLNFLLVGVSEFRINLILS